MTPVSAGAEKMNQLLQERRRKMNKLKNFRKQRIIKHYHKAQTNYQTQLQNQISKNQASNNEPKQVNPEVERKINFYNEVFNQPHVNQRLVKNKNKIKNKNKNKHNNQNQPKPKNQEEIAIEKLGKLKEKKVKIIKKMKVQKTSKGQPVMRNMIQYALTKIQQSIQKEKVQNFKKQDNKQPTANKNFKNNQQALKK